MKKKSTSSRAGEVVSSTRPPAGSIAARRRVTRKTQYQRPPRTAYDLLARVCEHILDEPKRYTQESYLVHGIAAIKNLGLAAPTCGTVGCRAGWIVALHDGPTGVRGEAVEWRANQILGRGGDTHDLFSGTACDRLAGEDTSPIIGTKKYARLGVKGLRAFMKQHAKHLKARLLKDVPTLKGPR